MIEIVYEVEEYRSLLGKHVNKGDTVIEIGPHIGKSTTPYIENASLAVAVDIAKQSDDIFMGLTEKYPQLKFVWGDARKFETIEKVLEHTLKCDVLAVDLGGGRFPDTVFKVWAVWSGIFKPKHSIIRNRGLAEFVQRAKVADSSIIHDFGNDGWMSEWGRSVPYKLRKQLEEFTFWIDL